MSNLALVREGKRPSRRDRPLSVVGPPAIAVVLATLCVGCTVLSSETLEQVKKADRAPRGVFYSLPVGTARATLTVLPSKTEFTMTITQGDTLPDPRHRFFLRYRSNPAYKDDVTASVDEKSLLKTVSSTTEDMTPQIVVALVKGATALGAGFENATPTEQPMPLVNELFDPTNEKDIHRVRDEINDKIAKYLGLASKTCGYFSSEDKSSPSSTARTKLDDSAKTFKKNVHLLTAQRDVIDARIKAALKSISEKPLASEPAPTPQANDKAPKNGAANKQQQTPNLDCKNATDNDVKLVCALREQLAETNTTLGEEQDKLDKKVTASDAIKAQQTAQETPCKAVRTYTANAKDRPRATITVSPSPHEIEHRRRVPAKAPDCTEGLCYRPKEAFRIEYTLGEAADAVSIELPNATDLVGIDIRRAFLVQKIQTMTFTDGYLTQLTIKKGSELAALAAIPANVLNAIGDGLAINANITTAQKNAVAEEVSLLQARQKLRDATPGAALENTVRLPQAPRGAVSRRVEP